MSGLRRLLGDGWQDEVRRGDLPAKIETLLWSDVDALLGKETHKAFTYLSNLEPRFGEPHQQFLQALLQLLPEHLRPIESSIDLCRLLTCR